jgi:hypothetical protein
MEPSAELLPARARAEDRPEAVAVVFAGDLTIAEPEELDLRSTIKSNAPIPSPPKTMDVFISQILPFGLLSANGCICVI